MAEGCEVADSECLGETESAIRVRTPDKTVWVPKSLLDEASEVVGLGDKGNLVVAEWFAIREGLI